MRDHLGLGRSAARRIALGGVLVAVLLLAFVWFQRPLGGDPTDLEVGVVRLNGSCCLHSAVPLSIAVEHESSEGVTVLVRFTDLAWSYGEVSSSKASFSYTVSQYDGPDDRSSTYSDYRAEGLAVGDSVTHGPVTIEVLAIHNMILSRNDAVDLRVTFDEEKLGEAP